MNITISQDVQYTESAQASHVKGRESESQPSQTNALPNLHSSDSTLVYGIIRLGLVGLVSG